MRTKINFAQLHLMATSNTFTQIHRTVSRCDSLKCRQTEVRYLSCVRSFCALLQTTHSNVQSRLLFPLSSAKYKTNNEISAIHNIIPTAIQAFVLISMFHPYKLCTVPMYTQLLLHSRPCALDTTHNALLDFRFSWQRIGK
jgi:hypothetical protein